jgi:hypothetical protein
LKIFLDEGVPEIIKERLSSFSIFSVKEMAWRGITNGRLLDLMSEHEFQIIITADKNLPQQQNLTKRKLSAIILPANDIPTVIELLPEIAGAIDTILPGDFQLMDKQ